MPNKAIMRRTRARHLQRRTKDANEQLIVSSVRQHEIADAAEKANARLQEEIAAHRRTEVELAEKARLLDLSNDAIMVRDRDNKITFWNTGAEKLFGWPREQAIGKDLHTLLQTEFPKPMNEILEDLHREGRFAGEVTQITRDGHRVPSLCRWVYDAKTGSIMTSYTDITERKRAEESLLRAQAQLSDRALQLEGLVGERTAKLRQMLDELAGFSYSIVHDLRAPLRALQGFSHLLKESYGGRLDERGQDYLRRIEVSTMRMDKFIQDVLSYSRVLQMDLRLEPVNADKLLRDILDSYPDFHGPNVDVTIEGALPEVLANETALTQCFSNLLNNAIKFVPADVKPRVRISAERHGKRVRFWIADEGIGIEARYFEKIFEMFQRLDTSYPGTGVGLALVRKLAGRMGGEVGLESEPGRGSRFWLELRSAPQQATL